MIFCHPGAENQDESHAGKEDEIDGGPQFYHLKYRFYFRLKNILVEGLKALLFVPRFVECLGNPDAPDIFPYDLHHLIRFFPAIQDQRPPFSHNPPHGRGEREDEKEEDEGEPGTQIEAGNDAACKEQDGADAHPQRRAQKLMNGIGVRREPRFQRGDAEAVKLSGRKAERTVKKIRPHLADSPCREARNPSIGPDVEKPGGKRAGDHQSPPEDNGFLLLCRDDDIDHLRQHHRQGNFKQGTQGFDTTRLGDLRSLRADVSAQKLIFVSFPLFSLFHHIFFL